MWVCVCMCLRLLISVFAKWSKWEPTGSCALHFSPSSSSPSLPLQSHDVHTFRAALISLLIIGLNHREPPHPLGQHSKHEFILSIPFSLCGRTALTLFPPSLPNAHRQAQYSALIKQINYKPRRQEKRGFALTLYFQWWTKKHKPLGAPLPLRQWQRKK